MFFFGKKKAEPDRTKEEAAPKADKDGLLEKASELIRKLDTVQDKKEKTVLLNEIGSCYFQADEKDQAIYYYEQSLEEDRQLGKAYTDLLKLYNKKRQEAAEAKDDEKLKEYMDKVQGLMQMSKDVLRGKM